LWALVQFENDVFESRGSVAEEGINGSSQGSMPLFKARIE
jgi:hypothetical protein